LSNERDFHGRKNRPTLPTTTPTTTTVPHTHAGFFFLCFSDVVVVVVIFVISDGFTVDDSVSLQFSDQQQF